MSIQELIHYWQVIRKRLWLVALLVGVTLGTVLLVSYLAKPLYRATASFQVTAPLPTDVSLVNEFRLPTSREELAFTRNNFLAVLQSEAVAWEVINTLGLNVDPVELQSQLVIEAGLNSDFVTLQVTADSPKQAAEIANLLVDTAARTFGELSASSFTANKRVISDLLVSRKAELDTAQAALVAFQTENKVSSADGILATQEKLIVNAKTLRDQAQAEGKLDEVRAYDTIITTRERELQQYIQLNAEFVQLEADVVRLQATYYDLQAKEIETELKENEILSARFVRVIAASEPNKPLPNLDTRVLIIAFVASLALAIVLAFILEYVETNRRTSRPSGTGTGPLSPLRVEPGHD